MPIIPAILRRKQENLMFEVNLGKKLVRTYRNKLSTKGLGHGSKGRALA
jgi:predicted transcriptional regulator